MPSELLPDQIDYVDLLGLMLLDARMYGRQYELADNLLSALSFLVRQSGAVDENALWATGILAERSGLTEPGGVRH